MLEFMDMKRPLIGITSGEIYNREYPFAPVAYGQMHTYIDMIILAGGSPVVLPLTKNESVLKQLCEQIDGLLLSGGNDINPSMYNELPYTEALDPSGLRDRTEKLILKDFFKTPKPILGICRGMQFINVFFGGSLYQDIKTDLPDPLNHELSTELKDPENLAHPIDIERQSKLYQILGTEQIKTNSHHHQAIKKLGAGLRISAASKDKIIEAIETDDDRFIIALQAHPESLHRVESKWTKLFEAFVDASRSYNP